MKHRWAALPCVLALGALGATSAVAQSTSPPPQQGQRVESSKKPSQSGSNPQPAPRRQERSPGGLAQNYPNPFNPSTTIPFTVGDTPNCTDSGTQHRVTLRIFNALAQEVAVPILQGGNGRPVRNLSLQCGSYTAFWDGNYRGTGREVASGVYIYVLEIDGKNIAIKKMLVTK